MREKCDYGRPVVSYPKHIKSWQTSLQDHFQPIFSLFSFPLTTHGPYSIRDLKESQRSLFPEYHHHKVGQTGSSIKQKPTRSRSYMGHIGTENSVSGIALNAAPCCSGAKPQHVQKTSPGDLPFGFLQPSWTLGSCETCTAVQPLAFEFTRWKAWKIAFQIQTQFTTGG